MTLLPTDAWSVFVISAGRAANVHAMERWLAPDPITWVVPERDLVAYLGTGAERVVGIAPVDSCPLPAARNCALAIAAERGTACIQVSDDLRHLSMLSEPDPNSRRRAVPSDWPNTRTALLEGLRVTGLALAGGQPTANPFYAQPGIKTCAFVIGDLTVDLDPAVGWAPDVPLKEDYDHTCRHLDAHGGVARVGHVLAEFAHYTNAGGAVAHRTTGIEDATTAQLLRRWPQYLRPHPRRPHELLLTDPRRRRG